MNYLAFLKQHCRFLGFGFALAFFSSFGQTFFISLSGEEIRNTFDLTDGEFGGYYALATLASGLTIIWVGQKLDTIDLRLFSVLICLGLAIACLGMGVASSIIGLTVAIYLLRLTGQGLLSHTAMTSMARYFESDRGKAMSVAGLGFPGGEAVLPVVAVLAMTAYGWRMTWVVIGGTLLVVVVPLVLWLLKGHRDRHQAHVVAMEEHHEALAANGGDARRQWTRLQVLGDIRFHLLLPAVMAPAFIVTGLFFHQVRLVEFKGWSLTMFAACFAVFAAAQLPASLLAGPIVDRFGARRLLPIFLAPLAIGLVVLASGRATALAPIFMFFAGITSGITGPIVGAMWAEVYGVKYLGAIRAMVTSIMVFATAASPISMGWLIDHGVTLDTISLGCAAFCVLSTVTTVAAMRLDRRRVES